MTVDDRIEQAEKHGASDDEIKQCGRDLRALIRLIDRVAKRDRYDRRNRAAQYNPSAAAARYERTHKFVFKANELEQREASWKDGNCLSSYSSFLWYLFVL
jgi:hypothetical protein